MERIFTSHAFSDTSRNTKLIHILKSGHNGAPVLASECLFYLCSQSTEVTSKSRAYGTRPTTSGMIITA